MSMTDMKAGGISSRVDLIVMPRAKPSEELQRRGPAAPGQLLFCGHLLSGQKQPQSQEKKGAAGPQNRSTEDRSMHFLLVDISSE